MDLGQVGLVGGYDIQRGRLVGGVESDLEYQGTSKVAFDHPPGFPIVDHLSADWTAHLLARAGIDIGGWLFYAGGGAAFANVFAEHTGQISPTTTFTWRHQSIRLGYDYMAGVETRLPGGWSLRAEYLGDYWGPKHYVWVAPNERYSNIGLTIRTLRIVFAKRF
jgi:opacity protein-like surface antigen